MTVCTLHAFLPSRIGDAKQPAAVQKIKAGNVIFPIRTLELSFLIDVVCVLNIDKINAAVRGVDWKCRCHNRTNLQR